MTYYTPKISGLRTGLGCSFFTLSSLLPEPSITKCSFAFDQGFEKTIDWYLENNEWLERVTSGAYADYYQAMYASR